MPFNLLELINSEQDIIKTTFCLSQQLAASKKTAN